MWIRVLLMSVLLLSIAGCATTRKEMSGSQVQTLQDQVSEMKGELRQRDEEIAYLEKQLRDTKSQKAVSAVENRVKAPVNVSAKMTPRNIQAALRNAGFYKGAIDGKIGKETEKAIRVFQNANGLTVDGIAGKMTCAKLAGYLN